MRRAARMLCVSIYIFKQLKVCFVDILNCICFYRKQTLYSGNMLQTETAEKQTKKNDTGPIMCPACAAVLSLYSLPNNLSVAIL